MLPNRGKTDMQPSRGKIIKRRVKEFTEFSTTQGVLQAGTAKRKVCLSFWIVVSIICTALMVWQIILLLQQYYEYDVDVQIQLRFEKRVFPAVTICNVNAYKKSIANQHKKINILSATYMYIARKIICQTVTYCNFQNNETLERHAEIFGIDEMNNTGVLQQRVRDLMKLEFTFYDLSPATSRLEEIVRSCSFNTEPCLDSYWSEFDDITMGKCFTFNLNSNLTSMKAGPMYGFRAILATNVSEYFPINTAAGLSVLVHDQDQYPFSDSLGYTISTGTHTTISVTYMEMARLDSPYGDCSNAKPSGYLYDMLYSLEGCQRSNMQKAMITTCGCYDPRYPVLPNNTVSACAIPQDLECMFSVTNASENAYCYQPCNEAMYTITTSTAKWPATSGNLFPGCFEGMYNQSCQETYEDNMLFVEVYYEKLNYESVTESPDDPFSITLSNLGGVIGLFLGMSIISVIEFMILGLQLCANIISPRIGKYVDY